MNKFNIDQKVYFVNRRGIFSGSISHIYLDKEGEISYGLKGRDYEVFFENMLYNTAEELLEFLKNSINKEKEDV
jgi:hypothetical protein